MGNTSPGYPRATVDTPFGKVEVVGGSRAVTVHNLTEPNENHGTSPVPIVINTVAYAIRVDIIEADQLVWRERYEKGRPNMEGQHTNAYLPAWEYAGYVVVRDDYFGMLHRDGDYSDHGSSSAVKKAEGVLVCVVNFLHTTEGHELLADGDRALRREQRFSAEERATKLENLVALYRQAQAFIDTDADMFLVGRMLNELGTDPRPWRVEAIRELVVASSLAILLPGPPLNL